MENRLQGNIWKSYIFQIFISLAFFIPIIVLFLQDNGLSMAQIMILQALFSITIVLLEIPSGYFADMYGRKTSILIATVFFPLSILTYGLGHNFFQFLFAEMLWALGLSFLSGTDSALLYDTLVDMKEENRYNKVWGNIFFFRLIGVSVASIAGGYIGNISFRLTFFAMLPFLILLIPIALSLKEPFRHKLIVNKGYITELLKILKSIFVKNKKLRWIILYSAIIFGFNQSAFWLYQPYFGLTGLSIAQFGFVFASLNIVAAIGSKYAHRLERYLGKKYSLVMLLVLVAGSYILMSNMLYLFSFSFAFLQQFARGFMRPVISDYINRLTSSDVRATVLSAQNMVSNLFYALIIPFVGWVADLYSITQAFTVLGFTTLVIGSTALWAMHKNKVL